MFLIKKSPMTGCEPTIYRSANRATTTSQDLTLHLLLFPVWILQQLVGDWPARQQHLRVHHGPVQQVDDPTHLPAQVSDQEAEDDLPLQVWRIRRPRGTVHGAFRGGRQRPE